MPLYRYFYSMIKESIQQSAKKYAKEFIDIRHHLHANPELSYKEFETSAFVQQKLNEWGIPFEVKATTGVVGLIKGKNPGNRIVALRADMDALPITEENDVDYKSKNDGVMHACGHDGHTAIGLTVAKILNQRKDELAGNIKFCFQPSEEGTNGEDIGGALMMMRDGVLEGPKVEKTLSLFVLWWG